MGLVIDSTDKNGVFKKVWTKEEIDILKKSYETRGSKYCKRFMPSRSEIQLISKANRMGLIRNNNKRFKRGNYLNKSIYNNKVCAVGLKNLICRRCLKEKEFNNINFRLRGRKDRQGNEQLDTICRECHRKRLQELRGTLFRFLSSLYTSIKGRQKNIDFEREYLYELFEKQKGLCALSNLKMTHKTNDHRVMTNISVDRIDSKKGYSKENVQLVCFWCNIAKQDLEKEDFIRFCNKVTKFNWACEDLW